MELEELYAFNEKLGNEFKRALKILKDKNIPDKFLLISAINRPTKVIGFDENVIANTTKIEGDGRALALSHLEPLSRRLAADISTLASEKNPKILFVGVGALGSKMIFHLARNGYTNITIIDKDILSPHNLVRHALFSDSISRNKAEDIANKLNKM
ncbi:ThiF family adenylyltransferase [Haloimpatiens massiliensis]|uniref:ThiF family adenylyltransferase n=1 Tax=Haloimpatiens massiliensis TaxID=1658110 RepID=UPI001FA838EA|nr:ThiF family adenylyltransferase [Haloimpatiens massiliensis]